MPAARTVLRGAADQDYRFSALVTGVVGSEPFRMRRQETPSDSPLDVAE
jgi:hypothetical protein